MLTLGQIRNQAAEILADVWDGESLDALSRALIALGVAMSVTALNPDAIRAAITAARAAGASDEQICEILALVAGLGVHSLMVGAAMVQTSPGEIETMDAERQALWRQYVGDNPYWASFERELPGFLRALLALSPASFKGFFDTSAIAWSTRTVPAVVKELAAMACDATPQHRFGPGFRLHLLNAKKLGAGRRAIFETLDIGAATADHEGIS